jgi:hypothetical protein
VPQRFLNGDHESAQLIAHTIKHRDRKLLQNVPGSLKTVLPGSLREACSLADLVAALLEEAQPVPEADGRAIEVCIERLIIGLGPLRR